MAWRVIVRDGPQVRKLGAADLGGALDLVEREGRALAAGPGRAPVALRSRSFSPQQQVAARVELRGRGVRAGIDVRGDGTTEAWTGTVRRRLVEAHGAESSYAALRRVLG